MGRLFIGREKHSFRTLDSTNNFAANLLNVSNPVEGTVIMAQHQTDGKGQRSKKWQDEAGKNLLLSVILRPTFLPIELQSLLNKTIALATYDAVKAFCDTGKVKIKWPNDILVDDKKIAGILIENTLRSQKIDTSIIGIGLNVMQMDFHSLSATSISMISNRPIPVDIVAERLMTCLEQRYLQLRADHAESIKTSYLENLYGLNQTKTFLIKEKEIRAKITGVDERGNLLLHTLQGETLACANGEITYLS